MRIALVAEDYYPQLGGVPEHVHNLALQLNAWGHTATVVTSHMGDYRDAPFVRRVGTSRVIYANGGVSRITTGWRLRRRLEQLFRAGRYDLVHVHGGLAPTLGLVAPFAAWRAGIPVVATFHSWFARSLGCRVFRRPFQRILDRHAATIAVSQPVVEANARYFELEWDVIPNGVDTTFFKPNGRGPTDALTDHPRLLFLGRIEPRNGLGTLLEAMPRILARYPRAVLTVAGDGPWRHYYERRARAEGLGASVRFAGQVFEDRPAYYGSADLYLCPTTIPPCGRRRPSRCWAIPPGARRWGVPGSRRRSASHGRASRGRSSRCTSACWAAVPSRRGVRPAGPRSSPRPVPEEPRVRSPRDSSRGRGTESFPRAARGWRTRTADPPRREAAPRSWC